MSLFPTALQDKKLAHQKLIMLTAYDAPMAQLLASCPVDVILVGDSLGNVFAGHTTTLPVTMDHMIYHTQAVRRGAPQALLIADMPFLSYQTDIPTAILNAGRLLKEGGAQGVKIETSSVHIDTVREIVAQGIPVLAHVGLTPQSVHQLGGYKTQGKTPQAADALVQLCQALEQAGAFAIVLECIPPALAQTLSQTLHIPTFGIGAGPYCDGQVLVTSDLLGLTSHTPPKFVTPYAQLYLQMKTAIHQFCEDIHQEKNAL